MASGALIILGALAASNANIQLLAAVADMGPVPGFMRDCGSVCVCAGQVSVPSRRGGWWRSPPRHLPVFAFVVGVASLGLFVFIVARPPFVGGSGWRSRSSTAARRRAAVWRVLPVVEGGATWTCVRLPPDCLFCTLPECKSRPCSVLASDNQYSHAARPPYPTNHLNHA